MSFSVSTLDASSAAQIATFADNMQRLADTNPATQAGTDALVQNVAAFYNKGEDLRDAGANINLADGINAGEYKSIADAISRDPTLREAIVTRHELYTETAQNNYAKEIRIGPDNEDVGAQIGDTHFGEFGTYENGVRNENGDENDSFAKAASDLSLLTQSPVTAPLTDKAQGGGDAGGAGGGEETSASGEETDGAGETEAAEAKDSGGSTDGGDIMSSLWPFLMGLLDEDGDGKISPEEFAKGMRKLDTNGDGKLSKDEMVAGGMSEEQADQMMTTMDANGDDAITLDGSESELDTFVTEANVDGNDEISETELGELIEPATETTNASTELALADM